MNFKSIITGSLLVVSLGLSPFMALAQDIEVRHEKVRFDDLDISRSAGAHAALERIAVASARVCRPIETPHDLAMWSERRQCMTKSIHDAVADLKSPIVTAMYEGRTTPPAYELASNASPSPVR